MAHSRVASRYVKSLLGLAVEKGALEAVHKDMQLLATVCASNRDFVLMLRNPVIKHELKRGILEKTFKGRVNALTFAILDILTRKNREAILPEIAREFHHAYNDHIGVGSATVTTAVPMDDTLRKRIDLLVKEISKKAKVEVTEKVDPDMIGGFILNVNDKQVDASIKNKLQTLRLKFQQNPYIKDF